MERLVEEEEEERTPALFCNIILSARSLGKRISIERALAGETVRHKEQIS